MARSKPKAKADAKRGRPVVDNPKKRVVSFRCSEEFGAWIDSFVKAERDTGPILIEKALVHYAQHRGFKPEPPGR